MVSAGRKAVVTGAASANGKALARRLQQDAAEVLDIDAERVKSVKAAGCKNDDADLIELVAAHAHDFDYHANAASVLRVKPILEVTVEDWRMSQTVSAGSAFFTCQLIDARPKPAGAASNLNAQRKQAVPLDRGASADERGALVCFLPSDATAYREERATTPADQSTGRQGGEP